MDVITQQQQVCDRYFADFIITSPNEKIGIAKNVFEGIQPINGLRISPENGTSGWYIWAGEILSEDNDFFLPFHISHVREKCPQIEIYLGLAPGWRFLITNNYDRRLV